MAIKDWKKIRENKWIHTKMGVRNSYSWIVEINTYTIYNKRGPTKNKKFGVVVWDYMENVKLKKKFKSKPQALKFARTYMRKH